jgi:hypothetical protein
LLPSAQQCVLTATCHKHHTSSTSSSHKAEGDLIPINPLGLGSQRTRRALRPYFYLPCYCEGEGSERCSSSSREHQSTYPTWRRPCSCSGAWHTCPKWQTCQHQPTQDALVFQRALHALRLRPTNSANRPKAHARRTRSSDPRNVWTGRFNINVERCQDLSARERTIFR